MIWSLIGSIGPKVLNIVDDVVEDKGEANRLKFEIQRLTSSNKPMVRVFFIDRNRIKRHSIRDTDEKDKGEPFYFIYNDIIYTGFCDLFDDFTNVPSPNE